jgi:triphosphoribosyl-dephospho-CoA synthase
MMPVLSNVVRSTARNPTNGTAPAARRLARLARQALIAEAELTPKPGLVDRRGVGAHTDLSLDIMRHSAVAIEPYFCRMAILSRGARPSQSMREQLALIGRHAEHAMLEATGGSNSHKGAIWVLGLLVSAAAMHDEDGAGATAVATQARDIASFEDRAMPRLVSHGDAVAMRYGVAGARGEALCGFPHVMEIALPMLRRRRQHGATEQVARLDALLSVISRLDDTCVLYRGGKAALATAKEGAVAVEAAGGSGTALGKQRLRELDRRLLDLNVSPGGSADLLAAALFLDAVERRQNNVAADESVAELSQRPTEVSQSLTGTSQSPAGVSQGLAEVSHGTH